MSIVSSSPFGAAGMVVGRVLLASLFLLEGWSKLRGYDAAVGYMNRFGAPGILLPAVIAVEFGAGLMVVAGWQTRLAAIALAVFCVLTAVFFHGNIAERSQLLQLEKNFAIAGGFLVLAIAGAGRWSLDHASGR